MTPKASRLLLAPLLLFLLLILPGCKSSKRVAWKPSAGTSSTARAYNNYIEKNANRALVSQKIYRVPASITLAQGLLESGAGRSTLARKANNHFGIKCHGWRGRKFYQRDDGPRDCFRVYGNIQESYDDHGKFLRENSRYDRLFKLDMDDYKGWAKGLQRAGYATDRGYANKLIKIIEDYRLYLITDNNPDRRYAYNEPKQPKRKVSRKENPVRYQKPATTESATAGDEREVFVSYGLLYVLAKADDDLASIARDFDLSERRLQNFNDFPKGYPLHEGDIVYLQKKLLRAEPPYYEHTVAIGESIHGIAQTYGLQLSALYRLNGLTRDYEPTEGDILRLR